MLLCRAQLPQLRQVLLEDHRISALVNSHVRLPGGSIHVFVAEPRWPFLQKLHDGPNAASPHLQLPKVRSGDVQQLESHPERLLPRSVLGCKDVLLAEALAFALRVMEVGSAQPIPEPLADDTVPQMPHLLGR